MAIATAVTFAVVLGLVAGGNSQVLFGIVLGNINAPPPDVLP